MVIVSLMYMQPTGGPILLHDTQPSESKELLELKVKKTPTQPAPAAGASSVGDLTSALGVAFGSRHDGLSSSNDRSGAAEAAAVLNAVDEDEEDGEEAEVPHDFEYESEGEEEE